MPIIKAYEVLFGKPPSRLSLWQVAKAVIENFDGGKLGEVLGRDALEHIVLYVDFPDRPTTTEVVGRAEDLLPEVSTEYSPCEEVHMATVSRVVWQRQFA